MARVALTAAAALLLLACAAEASRIMIDADLAPSGRQLLAADCSGIANCAANKCRFQRIPGTTRSQAVCMACATNYRLRRGSNGQICDCAPGFYKVGGTGNCVPCTAGNYCTGGPDNAQTTCNSGDVGLTTLFNNSKSEAQCVTVAGYGRVQTRNPTTGKVTVSSAQCTVGTYNVGGNQAACQKCGAGLITANNGSTSSSLCIAPAGSYKDRGVGKLCPRGTWSAQDATGCTACGTGLTTENVGATDSTACNWVQKGYKFDSGNAVECELHSYNDVEGNVTSCTPCSGVKKTQATGSTGAAECLYAPGVGSDGLACASGTYKEGWNLNACDSCGNGGLTSAVGSVSKAACMVPAGMGLTSAPGATWAVANCTAGTYGADADRPAVNNVRCQLCPPGTTSAAASQGEASCVIATAGWGFNKGGIEQCAIGTYNEAGNRLACQACPAGKTTADVGGASASACITKAGWKLVDTVPQPCDKGSYSTEGANSCTSCNSGYTTQEAESTSSDDCNVCAPGFGGNVAGNACEVCPAGKFSAGGSTMDVACTPCAVGTTSGQGATEDTMCVATMQPLASGVLTLGGGLTWTGNAANDTEEACKDACDLLATCIMYRFTDVAANVCEFLIETGAGKLGLKIGNGATYVVYNITATGSAGVAIGSAATGVGTQAACQANCDANPACEAFVYDSATASGTCTISKSEDVQDATSMFHVDGDKLNIVTAA